MMETKRKKQKIEGKEITEGNTGEPFGGKATKPSRETLEVVGNQQGMKGKQNPFGINSKTTPKRKTKREIVR